jgi:hypothetical protein
MAPPIDVYEKKASEFRARARSAEDFAVRCIYERLARSFDLVARNEKLIAKHQQSLEAFEIESRHHHRFM